MKISVKPTVLVHFCKFYFYPGDSRWVIGGWGRDRFYHPLIRIDLTFIPLGAKFLIFLHILTLKWRLVLP